MFIDAHCHIDFYKDSIRDVVSRAKKSKVGIIINNGINPETNRASLTISGKYNEVKAALGLYPSEAVKLSEKEIDREIAFIKKNKKYIIAIGEIGLDKKEDIDFERQVEIFKRMIKLARELDKPVIIHSRKAELECINVLEELKAKKVLMHCFSGNMRLLAEIVQNGWLVSIPAIIKYSEHFQEIVRRVPISQLLAETDSPYLHPEKKENNEPSSVLVSYEMIAKIKSIQLKDVERQLEKNARLLFGTNYI